MHGTPPSITRTVSFKLDESGKATNNPEAPQEEITYRHSNPIPINTRLGGNTKQSSPPKNRSTSISPVDVTIVSTTKPISTHVVINNNNNSPVSNDISGRKKLTRKENTRNIHSSYASLRSNAPVEIPQPNRLNNSPTSSGQHLDIHEQEKNYVARKGLKIPENKKHKSIPSTVADRPKSASEMNKPDSANVLSNSDSGKKNPSVSPLQLNGLPKENGPQTNRNSHSDRSFFDRRPFFISSPPKNTSPKDKGPKRSKTAPTGRSVDFSKDSISTNSTSAPNLATKIRKTSPVTTTSVDIEKEVLELVGEKQVESTCPNNVTIDFDDCKEQVNNLESLDSETRGVILNVIRDRAQALLLSVLENKSEFIFGAGVTEHREFKLGEYKCGNAKDESKAIKYYLFMKSNRKNKYDDAEDLNLNRGLLCLKFVSVNESEKVTIAEITLMSVEKFLGYFNSRLGDFYLPQFDGNALSLFGIDTSLAKRQKEIKGPEYVGEDLRGENFSQRDLTNARFRNCNLFGVNFSDLTLDGAIFDDCDLRQTLFHRAKLGGAIITKGKLEGAEFNDAALFNAKIAFDFPIAWDDESVVVQIGRSLEQKSILTAIASINNMYKDVKTKMMELIVLSLRYANWIPAKDALIAIHRNKHFLKNRDIDDLIEDISDGKKPFPARLEQSISSFSNVRTAKLHRHRTSSK